MAVNETYKVIVSDRAKQMPGTHIRSMAQVNKEAASDKKKRDCSISILWVNQSGGKEDEK